MYDWLHVFICHLHLLFLYAWLHVVTYCYKYCLLMLDVCVYVCVLSMFMLMRCLRVCWCIIYVYDCILSTYTGMVDVIMHEVTVCVVIWSCSDDWVLSRMMLCVGELSYIFICCYAYVYTCIMLIWMMSQMRYPPQITLRYVGLLCFGLADIVCLTGKRSK